MKKSVIILMFILSFSNVFAQIYSVGNDGGLSFSCVGSVGNEVPLPIELLFFDAECDNEKINLKWATASQINNDYFTLKRSSNQTNFETIATIKGAGNNSQVLKYAFFDKHPFNGVNYYMLKQTDFDGHYTHSNIIAINFTVEKTKKFILFPNPPLPGSQAVLHINSNADEIILVVVRDITGNEIYSKTVVLVKNAASLIAIDPENKLSSGLYMVTATWDNTLYNQKLIIK